MISTYDNVELSIDDERIELASIDDLQAFTDLKIDHDFADLCRAQMGEVKGVIEFKSTWPPPADVDETTERDLEGSWLWQ